MVEKVDNENEQKKIPVDEMTSTTKDETILIVIGGGDRIRKLITIQILFN